MCKSEKGCKTFGSGFDGYGFKNYAEDNNGEKYCRRGQACKIVSFNTFPSTGGNQ